MMRVLRLMLVLAACLEAARPITHEDVWLMPRVGAPVPSPDGKWVVVSVTEPAYEAKDQVADLWIVPANGSAPPRRLTHTKGPEGGAAWSPDSSRIVFTARRDGDEDSQVYLLDIAGGEAMRITRHPGGVTGPAISPDGRRVLFQAEYDPVVDRKSRKYNARVFEIFPIRYWDKWLDEKRPRLYIQDLDASAKPADVFGSAVLPGGTGFHGVAGVSGSALQAVWSPGGESIVFTATVNRHQAAFADTIYSLYSIPASGGEPTRITEPSNNYSAGQFSPDGRTLYALQEQSGAKAYSLSRLAAVSWPASPNASPRIVSKQLDRSVGTFGVTPDSATIYATAEEHGHEKIYRLPASGGAAALAFDMKEGTYFNLRIPSRARDTLLIANFDSSTHPGEAVRIDVASGGHSNLTSFGAARASEIDWQPPRHFWFTARNGRRIHNMLFLPPGFDAAKKYPLVTFIHGGPHSMSRDQFHTRWNYHFLASPGYLIFTTNYTGSTGFGEAFAQAIQEDPLKGPGEEINQAADEAIRQFPFVDGSRQAAGGASYGGHLANWLQSATTRYKCLFSHAGLINLESQWGTSDTIYHREVNNGGPVWEQGRVWREQNPIRYAARFKTPMLLTVGELDYRVPLNQTIENWSVLQRQRIPSRLVVFPEENHWILKGENNRFFFQQVHGWLKQWL